MGYNSGKGFLTVHEVAKLLRLSVLTIYKYIKNGKLEAIEFGRHYRIRRSSLEKFIELHKVKSPLTNNLAVNPKEALQTASAHPLNNIGVLESFSKK